MLPRSSLRTSQWTTHLGVLCAQPAQLSNKVCGHTTNGIRELRLIELSASVTIVCWERVVYQFVSFVQGELCFSSTMVVIDSTEEMLEVVEYWPYGLDGPEGHPCSTKGSGAL